MHPLTHTGRQTDSEELNQHSCSSSAFIVLLSSLKRLHSIFNQAPFARLCSTFSRFAPSLLAVLSKPFSPVVRCYPLIISQQTFFFSLKLDCFIYISLVFLNIRSAPPSFSAVLVVLFALPIPRPVLSCPPSSWPSTRDPWRDVPHPPRRRTSSSPSSSSPVSTGQEEQLPGAPVGGKQEHPFPLVSTVSTSVYVTACVCVQA